jgi:hypothetical protein
MSRRSGFLRLSGIKRRCVRKIQKTKSPLKPGTVETPGPGKAAPLVAGEALFRAFGASEARLESEKRKTLDKTDVSDGPPN